MSFFPFYMDISDKKILIVGGGKIAFHKLKVLLQFNTEIHIISDQICEGIYKLALTVDNKDKINISKRKFQDTDLLEPDIIIAATNDSKLNGHISYLSKLNNKLVNVVDVQKESDFIFPAMIKKKDLLLTISTAGKSPMFALDIKEELQNIIPDYYGDMVDVLGDYREHIKKTIPDVSRRNRIYKSLINYGKESEGIFKKQVIEDIIINSAKASEWSCYGRREN